MSLRKGRKVTIDGQDYRWIFKPHKDGQSRLGGSPRRAHVAIQEDTEKPGRPLVAWLDSKLWVNSLDAHQPRWGGELHRARFGPGDIRVIIEHSLGAGWDPAARKNFECPSGLHLTDYQTTGRSA